MIRVAGLLVATLFLSASAAHAGADISSTQEEYQVFRWKTDASKRVMIQAATSSLARYASGWQTTTPIVMDAPPPVAERFKLINPLANSPLAGLAALGGASALQFRLATCEGAGWISTPVIYVEGQPDRSDPVTASAPR